MRLILFPCKLRRLRPRKARLSKGHTDKPRDPQAQALSGLPVAPVPRPEQGRLLSTPAYPQMDSCPWAPSCSCRSSAASRLKTCSVWWPPTRSSGLPCSRGTPAPALSSGPTRVTPCRWGLSGLVGEPGGTPACEGSHCCPFLLPSQVPELELMPLETPQALPPMLIHGTFWQHWPSILLKGLSCRGRTHIHLATGLPGDPGVISGQCPAPLLLPCTLSSKVPLQGSQPLLVKALHTVASPPPTEPRTPALMTAAAPGIPGLNSACLCRHTAKL